MAKVRNLSDNQQEIAFTEFDFYQQYVETFKTSELGRDQVTPSSSRDGDIVRFGRREAEEFESEARKKVLLPS